MVSPVPFKMLIFLAWSSAKLLLSKNRAEKSSTVCTQLSIVPHAIKQNTLSCAQNLNIATDRWNYVLLVRRPECFQPTQS